MGKGIAVEFKKRFGGIAELKKQIAQVVMINSYTGGKRTGTAAFLNKDRLIFYLITKKTWKNKPTYESLQKSLEVKRETFLLHVPDLGVVQDMCSVMVKRDIRGVVMPKIGCGLDRLEWNKVHEIIKRTVSKVDIKIVICTL
uniref:Macro domain-containing protein n=1 Tax=Heterorhabditis bacteriophora TaxID=37862 RepID=A0A1I7XUA3_HETBA